MIQIDTSKDALENTGDNPYTIPADVQANPDDYGSPYDDMIGLLRINNQLLTRLANATERQRETPSETQINLSTVPYNNSLNYKTTLLVLSLTAAGSITLVIGTGNRFTFQFVAADTKVFPFIENITPGIDLSLTSSAGTPTGYLIAFPG